VDALVVAVSHSAYRVLQAPDLRTVLRGERPVLADVKGILPKAALEAAGVTVWRL
jgi:UDP-N-acetyl-D-galactosamine dehydrogenase